MPLRTSDTAISSRRRHLMAMKAGLWVTSSVFAAPGRQPEQVPLEGVASFLESARSRVEDVQFLFCDLQPELIASSTTVNPASLATASAVLARAGKILKVPMTFCVVPVAGQPGRLLPELAEHVLPRDVLQRTVTNPFLDRRIARALAANGRKTLVVAGFSAEVVVLQSALDAIANGYSAVVPVDAIGSRSARTESAALRQIELAGGVTTSVLSLLTRLAPDIAKSPGAEVFKALGALRAVSQ